MKSGWLLRQSTILRRWKKNWFDLWADGQLLYYDDEYRRDLEDKIHMKVECINLRTGHQCRDIQPPEGKSRDCLLQIICRHDKIINVCAESADDCLAWKIAFEEARTNTIFPGAAYADDDLGLPSAPPPYTEYDAVPPVYSYQQYPGTYAVPPTAQQVVYTSSGQPYAMAYQYPYRGPYAPEVNHVIVRERYHDNGDVALGMLAGAATGMALGSLFWAF